MRKALLIICALVTFLLLWEAMAYCCEEMLFVLPPPSEVFCVLWEMRSRFWLHTLATLSEMCGGFLLATCMAFPLAWLMMRYLAPRTLLQPVFILIQCIPMFTLAPIMVLWFGWSYIAIIIPTALMIFFPLTLNIYRGFSSIPESLLALFRSHQATEWQTLFKLRLPWALPQIFAGFRIAAAVAGIGAIAGEWAGAQEGLGMLMLESRRNMDLEITFGALLCLSLLTSSLYGLILYCEKVVLAPHSGRIAFASSQKWRRFLPWMALFLGAVLLSGCGKTSKPPTRLLLDWLPNPNHVPLYVGIDKGYFKEQGINLAIQKMHEAGGGMAYLTTQRADLLVGHMPSALKAVARGAHLKIAGVLIKTPLSALIYRAQLQIKKPCDLTGLSFGYCIGSPDMTFVNLLLEQGHIVPREIKNVSVDLVSAMATERVDFIYGGYWNIEPSQLRSLGVETEVFQLKEFGIPVYYEMIILADAKSEYGSADFRHKFSFALQKSLEFCHAHPEEAFAIFLASNPDFGVKTIEWQKEAWRLTEPLLAADQEVELSIIEEFHTWQLMHGMVKNSIDCQALIE